MKNKPAFTLIELILVIAIIVALIALLIPSLSRARSAAARVSCTNNMHAIALVIQNYASNNKGKIPTLNGTKGTPPVEQAFVPTNLRATTVLSELIDKGYIPGGERARLALVYDPGMDNNAVDRGASGHYLWNPHPADTSDPLPASDPTKGVPFAWPNPVRRWTQLSQIPLGRLLGCDLIYSAAGTAHHGSGKTEIAYWNLAFPDGNVCTVESSDLMTRFLIPLSKQSAPNNVVNSWPQLNDAIRVLELVAQGIDPKYVGSADGKSYAFEPVDAPKYPNLYYPPRPPGAPADPIPIR